MKFHLPKKLLVAVLAAMGASTVHAKLVTPTEVLNVTASDDVYEITSDTKGITAPVTDEGAVIYSPFVKDGDGKATISSSLKSTAPLYVREGALEIKGTDTRVTLSPGTSLSSGTGSVPATSFSVAGKNATLIVDGAYLKNDSGSALNVGGPNGSGTLLITNGGTVYNHTQGSSLFIGYHSDFIDDSNVHAVTTTPESTDKYEGVYVSDEGNNKTFGKGTVTVEKGSELWTGYSGLYMAEGELNVRENSKMYIGYDWGNLAWANGFAAPIGVHAYSTSIINVSGGSLLSMGSKLYTGVLEEADKNRVQDHTRVIFNVDGTDSLFIVRGQASSTGCRVFLGTNANLTSSTTINITNGGAVDFLGATMGAGEGKSTVDINVGTGSSFVVQQDLVINEGTTINCAGSVSANTLTATAGSTICLSAISSVETDAAITIGESWTMSEGSVFELSLSDVIESGALNVAVANVAAAGVDVTGATLKLNTLLWESSDLKWDIQDNVTYITGTLTKNESVSIEAEDVTLNSAEALGDTTVSTSGDTTLSTGTGVTVNLPDTIANSGNLSISGSYDGSSLDTIEVEDTRVCVDGKEGNNGFYREGGTAILVVDNKGNATLTVDDGTTVKSKDGDSLKLYASGIAAGELDYSNYHIEDGNHSAAMSEIQGMRPDSTADLTITMTNGELVADADATDVQSTGGTIRTQGNVEVGGKISGSTSVVVTGDSDATISGANDYTGDTVISGENARLTVGEDNALGQGMVQLHNKGTLDLNGKAIANDINVTGCELHNASAYTGNIDVSGNLTICGTDATAGKVTLIGSGTIAPEGTETLTLGTLEVAAGASAPDQIAADTTVTDSLVLNNGAVLTMSGNLTMNNGSTIVLQGKGYRAGQILVTAGADSDMGDITVLMQNGEVAYTLLGNNQVQLTAVFDQDIANACTITNWGMATASRAFVNAVRGQRSNTGCIANGRGTAWVAVLGGNHDIDGSDIDLKGAAVGADVKVGEKSSVGIAFGYVEGDVRPTGLRSADQEGTYVALYGEHGLRKLSSTSCLSLDWVATYGNTESDWAGMDWEQQSLQLNSRLNWNKKVSDRLCVSVFGGLEYYTSESDTVENVKTGSLQNLRGEIGVGARYVAWGTPAVTDGKSGLVLARGCEKLVLHGEIRYMNDMVRSNPVIEQDGLRGKGDANPGRQGMGIEAGATYRIGERWSASANYGFNTMDDSREHRVNVGASYTF